MPSQPLPGAGDQSASAFVPREFAWSSGWRLYALAAIGILAIGIAVTFWQQSRGVGREAVANALLAVNNSCEQWYFSDGTKQSRSCTSGITSYAYTGYGNNACPSGYQSSGETGTCDGDTVYRCVTSLSCPAQAPSVTLTADQDNVVMYQPFEWEGDPVAAERLALERTTITWGATGNITSCTTSGNWSNSGNTAGSGLTDPQTTDQTYTYQCTGAGGTSELASVTVTVKAPDLTVGSMCVGTSDYYDCSGGSGCVRHVNHCSNEAATGGALPVAATVSNQGTYTTLNSNGLSQIVWGSSYLQNSLQQADDINGTNARFITGMENFYAPIAPGSSGETSTYFSFGSPGSYFLRACADMAYYNTMQPSSLPELNENNNCGAWTELQVCQSTKGEACTSGANACGMTNSGTTNCDGTCSAQTPSNALCPQPPSCSTLQSSPTDANSGTPITLTWSCQNATSCTAINNSDGFSTGSEVSGADNSVTPQVGLGATNAVTYGMTCTGNTGLTDTFYFPPVTVHGPSATISATPGRVSTPPNNTSTITWSTAGGAFGCTAKKNGQLYEAISGDSGTVTEPVESKTTYTITCDSSLGQLIRSVTVFLPIGYTAF